mmetsp:Transcript_12772/g.43256  ORF Transcript_12772/g.43256 Transcript_12772/m.43256 type:complete len:361 (+) Transcript_12772:75-1157(+)
MAAVQEGGDRVQAYVFPSQGPDVVCSEVDQVPLGADMVEVAITTVSLCHTDLSIGINDWGVSQYPACPGHENVGIVSKVGNAVRRVKVGDRVAVGWLRHSCNNCRKCNEGDESLCYEMGPVGTGLIFTGPGGFASHVRVQERYAFAVPEALKSTEIAALLCAGITVYRPLRKYVTHPGARVGVVGVGGLGHLALKFGAKMGFCMVAMSRGTAKEKQALECGASEYVDSTDTEALNALKGSIDVLLYTASGGSTETYFPLMRNGGTIVQLGAPASSEKSQTEVPLMQLIFGGISYTGSAVGGSLLTNEMLNFAASHGISAEGSVHPITELPQRVKQLAESPKTCPFRFVFTTDAWDSERNW